MWRLLYLGDGVNHLPEPSWKESGALALNNVYAFGGARLSQTATADLAVTLQNGVLTATTKTATTADKRVGSTSRSRKTIWCCGAPRWPT